MKKRTFGTEVKVGIFFILCVIGLLYMTISTGKFHLSEEGYTVFVVFDDISGLQKNSPVMLNGLEVGRVKELRVVDREGKARIMLTLLVKEGTKIGAESVISIKTLGLMGEKFVHIKCTGEGESVRANATLMGKSPGDLDALFSEADVLAKNVNELTLEIKALTVNLNETVTENRESLEKTLANISTITDEIKLALKNNDTSLDNIIKNLDSSTENLDELTQDLKLNPWKLFFRTKEKKEATDAVKKK